MACTHANPCNECEQCTSNPCYENCGCLNPTTFECITKPGTHTALGVTNDMNGYEVLLAINTIINNLTVDPPEPGADIYVKVSSTDTTSDYLSDKLVTGSFLTSSILNPSGNEALRINANLPAMISTDAGNELEIGTDNKLRVIQTPIIPDVVVLGGSGVTVSGTGPAADPYVVSINPSITALRPCFDNVWRDLTLVATGNPDVVYVSGTPKYRIRFDGTIEFKGSATYTVNFGTYSSANRKRTVTIGNIPSTCLTLLELAGVADLKGINYVDQPGVGDQISQFYGYIIRKSTQNIIIEFQSAYIAGATKTIVVNFEGAISHPAL